MVDHSHEHGVAIAKVILDHTPGHPSAFGNVARGYRSEALFANASDGLVNDELAGPVASDLALDGSSSGSGPTGRARLEGRHRMSPRTCEMGKSRNETRPGGAAHTTGIALTAFIPVAITPASL